MAYHFTYTSKLDDKNLKQGDLLYRTPEIESLLKQIHPYYLKKSFQYFIVLTQSCDLVLRKGKKCTAKYISLAAVLPFDKVIKIETSKYQKDKIEELFSVFDKSQRTYLYNFIDSLLNNNQKEFFYLHEDNELGLPECCCAVLRLSIAIRANEHYDICLKAKFLELETEFRAKLGWLIGNIYSRVGTKDWAPDCITQNEFKSMINTILDKELYWIDKERLILLKEKIVRDGIDINKIDREAILSIAQNIKVPSKKDKILNVIEDKLKSSNILKDDRNLNKLLSRIKSDPVFTANLK